MVNSLKENLSESSQSLEKDSSTPLKKNTLTYLNSKVWYRTLKVLYILLYTYGLVLTIVMVIEEATVGEGILGFAIFIVAMEAIRRACYYIALGTINPKKYL